MPIRSEAIVGEVSIYREPENQVQAEPQPSDERRKPPVQVAASMGLTARLAAAAGRRRGIEGAERSSRVATAAALVVATVFPLIHLWYIFDIPEGGYRPGMWALAAIACYLPLSLRHVWFASHATRPPGGTWTLGVMAVVIIGALPLAGDAWVVEFSWLAVSVLIVVRRPWCYLIAVVLVAATLPAARLIGDPRHAVAWYTLAAACRCVTLFVLVWLAAAIRRLIAARRALAEAAVMRERLRIDDELRQTLGAALESIVARGQRAGAEIGGDCKSLETDLRALIEDSRATLARARAMVRSYQQVSLRAELDTAVALLSAIGIEAQLSLPNDDLSGTVEEAARVALRTALVRLLRDDKPPRTCLIVVSPEGSQTRLELRTDLGVRGMSEVAA